MFFSSPIMKRVLKFVDRIWCMPVSQTVDCESVRPGAKNAWTQIRHQPLLTLPSLPHQTKIRNLACLSIGTQNSDRFKPLDQPIQTRDVPTVLLIHNCSLVVRKTHAGELSLSCLLDYST